MQKSKSTRRNFLQQSGSVLAGATLAGTLSTRAYAGENTTIKIALVGCGGRGTRAALNALSTQGPTKLWADGRRLPGSHRGELELSLEISLGSPPRKEVRPGGRRGGKNPRIPQPAEQAGRRAAGPPVRRTGRLPEGDRRARPAASCCWPRRPPSGRSTWNMPWPRAATCSWKSRSPSTPRASAACSRRARRPRRRTSRSPAGCCRHDEPLEEAIAADPQGRHRRCDHALGLSRARSRRACGPARPGESELAHQIRNYSSFTWLNGSFFLDWLIHNLDICCWIKGAWPVSAQGQGGRQIRTEPDQLFDHYAVEYTLCRRHADDGPGPAHEPAAGTSSASWSTAARARRSWAKGRGHARPRIYKGHQPTTAENQIWKPKGP